MNIFGSKRDSGKSKKDSIERPDGNTSTSTSRSMSPGSASSEALIQEVSRCFTKKNQMHVSLGILTAQDIRKKIASLQLEIEELGKHANKASPIIQLPQLKYLSNNGNQYIESKNPSDDNVLMYSSANAGEFISIKKKYNSNRIESSILEADISSVGNILNADYPKQVEHIKMINTWSYPACISRACLQEIQELWFPKGLEIDYIHKERCTAASLSGNRKRLMTHYFNDSNASMYICCIVVDSVQSAPSLQWTKTLLKLKLRYRCALRINTFVNNALNERRKKSWEENMNSDRALSVDNQLPGSQSKGNGNSNAASNMNFFERTFNRANETSKPPDSTHQSSSSSAMKSETDKEKDKDNFSIFNVFNKIRGSVNDNKATPGISASVSTSSLSTSSNADTKGSNPSPSPVRDRDTTGSPIFKSNDSSSQAATPVVSPLLHNLTVLSGLSPGSNSVSPTENNKLNLDGTENKSIAKQDFVVKNLDFEEDEVEPIVKVDDELYAQRVFQDFRVITKKIYYMSFRDASLHSTCFSILDAIISADTNLNSKSDSPVPIPTEQQKMNTARSILLNDIDYVIHTKQFKRASVDSKAQKRDEDLLNKTKTKPQRIICTEPSNCHDNELSACNINGESIESKQVTLYAINVPDYCSLNLRCMFNTPTISEWSTAVLLTYLNPPVLIKLLKLVLSERSIIISGKSAGVVSAIAFAVKSLISPFTWQGRFIPVLTRDDLSKRSDDSAVRFKYTSYSNTYNNLIKQNIPFIIGTTRTPDLTLISNTVAVLIVDETFDNSVLQGNQINFKNKIQSPNSKETLRNCLSDPRVLEQKYISWFSRIPELSAGLHIDYKIEKQLAATRTQMMNLIFDRLRKLDENKQMLTPLFLFIESMSPSERDVVSKFTGIIESHNRAYTSSLLARGSWRPFAKKKEKIVFQDDKGGLKYTYQLSPEQLLEANRSIIEFQAAVSETQHFMSFFEKNRRNNIILENRCRLFIARWVWWRVYIRKKRTQGHPESK